jgi:hypothetical protein
MIAPSTRNATRSNGFPSAEGLPTHLLGFEKLDVVFLAFLLFALIIEALRVV